MNNIILYHYSNRDFNGKISPDFFGENGWTRNSAKISCVKRSYFYTNAGDKEYLFTEAIYRYTAEIDKDKLYNIDEDKLKLNGKYNSFLKWVNKLKSLNYIGFFGRNRYEIVCLFSSIKIKSKILLVNRHKICYT
jgi:hypothetical protein